MEGRRLLSGLPGAGSDDSTSGAGPMAEVLAGSQTEAGSKSFEFKVVYRDDGGVRAASIDGRDLRVTGPNGFTRRAALIGVDALVDGPTRVARYKVAPPGGTWDAADNGLYRIALSDGEVFDVDGNAARGGLLDEFEVALDQPTFAGKGGGDNGAGGGLNSGGPDSDVVVLGVDVRDFGAFPNDGVDDTAAIQAAIDSLDTASGVPIGSTPAGGIILFTAGRYDINRTIDLHSGVTLRGVGPATVIVDSTINPTNHSFELVSPFTHNWNIGVTLDSFTLISNWGGGVAVDPEMNGDVNDLRLVNLRISTGGVAIDLRDQAIYYTDIENVEVFNPGSTALVIDRWSYVNRIRNFSVTGVARPGFRREDALVYLNADALVDGMTISVSGARTLPLCLRGRTTFDGLDVSGMAAVDCPNGIAVWMQGVAFAIMDTIHGLGTGRRLLLSQARDVQIDRLASDGTSDLLSQLTVVDAASNLRVGNAAGDKLRAPNEAPSVDYGSALMPPSIVIDATHFGVIATDAQDDTAAVQAAIDSLPRGDGIPGDGDVVGGIVQLPMGVINTSGIIKLPSGVWLRGHGNGTTIQNWTLGSNAAVVGLTSPYAHGHNVGAGVVDLGIRATFAAAVRADPTVVGEIRNLRLAGLRLTVGGPAIDLRYHTVRNSEIERVVVHAPGSTALWLGKDDNSSTGNLVRAFRLMGRAPVNFVAEQALVVLHGETRVESGSIEDTFANVLPLYVSGKVHITDLYMEYPIIPSTSFHVLFDNVTGYVDHLWHVDAQRRLKFINNTRLTFGHLNIDGTTTDLAPLIAIDATSHVTMNTVNSQFDVGHLDHPRIHIKGVYSTRASRFIDTAKAMGNNLLADPNFYDVADDRAAQWEIHWGDQLGAVQGNFSVQTVNGERQLRITILSNPNGRRVNVRGKVNLPAWAVGKNGIARWRVDGAGNAIGWTAYFGAEYKARALNSLTAMMSPIVAQPGEQVWIDLPAAAGTYVISKVGYTVVT